MEQRDQPVLACHLLDDLHHQEVLVNVSRGDAKVSDVKVAVRAASGHESMRRDLGWDQQALDLDQPWS